MASPAWPPPTTSVSIFSTAIAGSDTRASMLIFARDPGAVLAETGVVADRHRRRMSASRTGPTPRCAGGEAGGDTEVDPPRRERIERHQRAGGDRRDAVRKDQHTGSQANPGRLRRRAHAGPAGLRHQGPRRLPSGIRSRPPGITSGKSAHQIDTGKLMPAGGGCTIADALLLPMKQPGDEA